MTGRPMDGVRVVEVAQFTFVPAAGALLADWGADVIKVEHAVHGDAARGVTHVGPVSVQGAFSPLMEHANRGKRSIGIAIEEPVGLEVLHELVRGADVFSTNFLPDARARLSIDVDDIRAINPSIVYLRGSALGARGPEAHRGGYDLTAYWGRGGAAYGVSPPNLDGLCPMPAPAHGDSVSALAMAAGVAAALFARERTGEGSVVDVSLLASAAWANAVAVENSLLDDLPWRAPEVHGTTVGPRNPLTGLHRTSDDRWIMLSMLQPGRYWADFCRHLDREDLITDPRFDTTEKLVEGAAEAGKVIAEVIASRSFDEWVKRFETLDGQWAPVQSSREVGHDPQLRANGFIAPVTDVDGIERHLVASPAQFDETPPTLRRGPTFAEQTHEILTELGMDDERIIELLLTGAVS